MHLAEKNSPMHRTLKYAELCQAITALLSYHKICHLAFITNTTIQHE